MGCEIFVISLQVYTIMVKASLWENKFNIIYGSVKNEE
jgi:hypothetical protein